MQNNEAQMHTSPFVPDAYTFSRRAFSMPNRFRLPASDMSMRHSAAGSAANSQKLKVKILLQAKRRCLF